MEEKELMRRAEDLSHRCLKNWEITNTNFLTPAESMQLKRWFQPEYGVRMLFWGGYEDCERCAAFFLPEEVDQAPVREMLKAVRYRAYFGEPGHRDYLGALLASGISRDRLGDILVEGENATVFCMPGIVSHLLAIERIGRISVRAEEIPPDAIVIPKRQVKNIQFTVMSLRLDAIAAGMFRLSRTACAEQIREGLLSLNYEPCMKTDAPVQEGDVLSLRGHGKGRIAEVGGNSRKGRIFVTAEIYV